MKCSQVARLHRVRKAYQLLLPNQDLIRFATSRGIKNYQRKLEKLSKQRDETQKEARATNEQSSETWQDNAPGEAAKHSVQIIDQRIHDLGVILRTLRPLEYPKQPEKTIRYGTQVTFYLRKLEGTDEALDGFSGEWTKEKINIVGYGDVQIEGSLQEPYLDRAMYDSPLVQAIYGREEGESFIEDIKRGEDPRQKYVFSIEKVTAITDPDLI